MVCFQRQGTVHLEEVTDSEIDFFGGKIRAIDDEIRDLESATFETEGERQEAEKKIHRLSLQRNFFDQKLGVVNYDKELRSIGMYSPRMYRQI